MATCATCGSTILFGGVRHDPLRYCNAKCASKSQLLSAMTQISDADAQDRAQNVRTGPCPKCGGVGQPVDVERGYRVFSYLLGTSWSTQLLVSCRPCGNKLRAKELAISLVFGWWGFPWGFLITPVQVGRNLLGLVSHENDSAPSAQLVQIAKMALLQERGLVQIPDA